MPDLARANRQALPVLPSNVTHVKVLNGGTTTIPQSRNVAGFSGGQGAQLVTAGVLLAVTSNDAGVNEMSRFQPIQLSPGDVVAVVVAANVLTVTINTHQVFRQVGTALTVASAMLYYA